MCCGELCSNLRLLDLRCFLFWVSVPWGSVCLFPGNKRGGIWTNVYYSEYNLCVRCCVRPWPKGRQTDLAFSPVFEEFVAWIAVQDLETLTSKRSAELYVGKSGDLSSISGLGKLSQGDPSKSSSHTFVVTLKKDSLYQWLETVASLKERKAAWFLLWLLDGTFFLKMVL